MKSSSKDRAAEGRPRLVKAKELAARAHGALQPAAARAAVTARRHVRVTPRSASEARAIFNALFLEPRSDFGAGS